MAEWIKELATKWRQAVQNGYISPVTITTSNCADELEQAERESSTRNERETLAEMPKVTPEQAIESLNEFTRFWHRIGGDQGDAPDAHLTRRFIHQAALDREEQR